MGALTVDMEESGVLHVFSVLDRGGAELRTLDVVRQTGMRFVFLSVSGRRGGLDEAVRDAGHCVHHLRVRGPSGMLRAIRLLKAERVRVVHSHLGAASSEILLAAWIARVPVRIAHCRSDAVGGRRALAKTLYLALSAWVVRSTATAIVAVSPSSLAGSDLQRGRWRTRARVLPNGLDAATLRTRAERSLSARQRTEERLVVANVARLDKAKNRVRAIRIWAEIAKQKASTLKLIGPIAAADAEYARTVSARPEVLATGSCVEYVGESELVPEHLGDSDVLLMTSMREGLPGVVLEALATGTPVVASNLPGVMWISSLTKGITSVSLEADDEEWCRAVLSATASGANIAESFAASPFQIGAATDAHLMLWGLR